MSPRLFFLPLIFLLGSLFLFSQEEMEVRGIVKDAADNQPMPAVTVVIKGTFTGTITDLDGSFSLPGVKPDDVLSLALSVMKQLKCRWMDKHILMFL